jgi:UDP-N-acetylglucosamine 2-epimerase (non-hydrolysing)/UDP-GlcNAc3NAcA epimerase
VKVVTVIGNRPQFIKAAAVSSKLRREAEEVLVHTGQHFDDELSGVFFAQLGLPTPDRELGTALGTNTSQTARMLTAIEPVIATEQPDVVLVYGDTNSTLAGALAGAQATIPVAHIEAGMRSYDRTMPEELNRVLTDHASTLLLCSTELAVENLRQEGFAGDVQLVGDLMVDVALSVQPLVRERQDLVEMWGVKRGEYLVATAHRAGNVDDFERLEKLVELLLAMSSRIVLALHPRTRARLVEANLLGRLQESSRIAVTPPLGYIEMAALVCSARAVLTDSGGLQKEAYMAGVPCITMRARTEWTETVDTGWNVLVDLDAQAAQTALERPLPPERPPLYGDGGAGERIVSALTQRFA